MTATNRLRELLKERGVEWMPVAWNPQRQTFYQAANGVGFCANEYTGGVRIYTDATITPERAVEATLGRGECRNIYDSGSFKCSECGHFTMAKMVYRDGTPAEPRYCPWCGRKVVQL